MKRLLTGLALLLAWPALAAVHRDVFSYPTDSSCLVLAQEDAYVEGVTGGEVLGIFYTKSGTTYAYSLRGATAAQGHLAAVPADKRLGEGLEAFGKRFYGNGSGSGARFVFEDRGDHRFANPAQPGQAWRHRFLWQAYRKAPFQDERLSEQAYLWGDSCQEMRARIGAGKFDLEVAATIEGAPFPR